MKVKDLIDKLKEFNPDSDIWFKCFDGTDYKNNIAHTERAKLVYYKDVNELEIDLINYFALEYYDFEKYNRLNYTYSETGDHNS